LIFTNSFIFFTTFYFSKMMILFLWFLFWG